MNRHARVTEMVDKKNDKMYFAEFTTNTTKTIIKEYQKIWESFMFRKAKGWGFGEELFDKMCILKNKMANNEQTKNIVNEIHWGTYDNAFCNVWNTKLNVFLINKHISRF